MSRKNSVIIISILIFWMIIAPKAAIIPDTTISGWITNFISLFLLWYLRYDLKYIFVGKNKTFNILLLTYLAVSVYSVYYNADTISKFELSPLMVEDEKLPQAVTSVRHILYYSIGLFASSLYIQKIANTIHIRTLLITIFILLLIVLVPSYIEVFTTPIGDVDLVEYSVGNKFTIGYYHLYLCTIYYLLFPCLDSTKQKLGLLFLIASMAILSNVSQCSTMIMAAFVFLFFSFLIPDTWRNNLASAKVILISVLVFGIGFFFLASGILQYDFIQYFIKDVLGEDITLTGRLQIFEDIQEAFTDSPWVGLGYGNSIVISRYYTDAYDSQNGLIELFIQVGVVGVAAFLSLLYNASKTFEKNAIVKCSFVAFMYAMIAIATIEIPYKFNFIFFLSFCFIQNKSYQRPL